MNLLNALILQAGSLQGKEGKMWTMSPAKIINILDDPVSTNLVCKPKHDQWYTVKGFHCYFLLYNINETLWVLIHWMLGIVKKFLITIPVTRVWKKMSDIESTILVTKLTCGKVEGRSGCTQASWENFIATCRETCS